jgi:hypothetical protein
MTHVYNLEGVDNKLLKADDLLLIANNKHFIEEKKKQLESIFQEYQQTKEKEFASEILVIHQQLEKQLDEILFNMESRALAAINKIVKQLHLESIAPDYILSVIQNELNHYRDTDNVVIITCHQSYVAVLEEKLKFEDVTILYNGYEGDSKHVVFIENKYLKTKFDINVFLNSAEEFINKMQQQLLYYQEKKNADKNLEVNDESIVDELDIIA